jgi:hypothetical protein
MQFRKDDFYASKSCLGLHINRNTASFVTDFHTGIFVELYLNGAAMTTQSLVDRVVNDFPETVHESARVSGSDIHTGTLTNRIQTFKNGQMASGIL